METKRSLAFSRKIATFPILRRINPVHSLLCRSQWLRGLRRRSAAVRLLRLWVRIPPGVWMFVCCECCVLSGRGLCDELIIHPEESYRLWCVIVCDLETSWMRRPLPTGGMSHQKLIKTFLSYLFRYALILFSYLRQSLPPGVSPSGFSHRISYEYLCLSLHATCATLIWVSWLATF
jgi:hypothetical protein